MHGHVFNPRDLHKLEDPERLNWLPPDEVARMLGIAAGMRVADIGAGSGFFAIPFARRTSPARLLAVDLQPAMLEILRTKLQQHGSPANIELIEGAADATNLASDGCDLAFLANVWHEVEDQAAVLREVARILAPGGRLAILDWRTDVQQPPGPPIEHRIAAGQVAATLSSAGWKVRLTAEVGSHSYLAVGSPPSA